MQPGVQAPQLMTGHGQTFQRPDAFFIQGEITDILFPNGSGFLIAVALEQINRIR
jgi:hypothetical protein